MNRNLNKIILYIVFLALGTALFKLFNLDLTIQKYFFDFTNNTWKFANLSVIQWLYKYGTYPAIVLTVIAIFIFIFGFVYEGLKKHRKAALLIILTMFIGPGLVTNVILKNNTGRPRPRDIVEFNGKMNFKQPLEFGVAGKGFSFPCGHCTMGFFFYAAYLILRKKHKKSSYVVLAGSVIYGSAMGLGRIAQGGHFASDVLWAAGITFIIAETLHIFVVKTDNQESIMNNIKIKNKMLAYALALMFVIITALIFLIATPFNLHKEYALKNYSEVEIISNRADITVGTAINSLIKFQATGFGLPWSKYNENIKTEGNLIYMATAEGLFSELNSSINLYMANANSKSITITAEKGNIYYNLGQSCNNIYLSSEKGNIEFNPLGKSNIRNLVINSENGNVIVVLPKLLGFQDKAYIEINAPKGDILIKNGTANTFDMNKLLTKPDGSKQLFTETKGNTVVKLKAEGKSINIEAQP
ncbi:MAG: phosphatase PAP2 family protein [bacterium]